MSESKFFVRGRNRGNERQIILSSATLLVGKAPTKAKRIKMRVRMPLTGRKPVGTRDWILAAMSFVAQSHDTVQVAVELSGFDIEFSDDTLFNDAKAKAQKCQMRGFVVEECGDSENPHVEMGFLIYAPFSTGLWKFCGQMGGDEIWAKFTQVDEPEPEDLELTSDEEEEEPEVEEATAE